MSGQQPLISVCLITYNHEKFIEQALDGILIQETSFPFEVVISDDLSTDNTRTIINEFIQKNSCGWNLVNHTENVGMHRNWERAIRTCKGKYIALLEGDDYWSDPLKLQKQIDILEADNNLSICCSNAGVELIDSEKKHSDYVQKGQGIYTLIDLIEGAFMPTCTVVFRNGLLPETLPKSYYAAPMADYPIHLLNALHGDIFYLNEVTVVYRLHEAGEWGRLNPLGRLKHILGGIQCAESILTNKEHQALIKKVKKDNLFKIASWYKSKNQFPKYVYYRLRTRLAL